MRSGDKPTAASAGIRAGLRLEVFPPSTDWACTQKRLRDFAHAFRNMNADRRLVRRPHPRTLRHQPARANDRAQLPPPSRCFAARHVPGFAGGGNRRRRLASLSRCATGEVACAFFTRMPEGSRVLRTRPALHLPEIQPNPPRRPHLRDRTSCLQLAAIRRALFAEGHERFHRFR